MHEMSFNGMLLKFDGLEFWVEQTGIFNVYNLILVYAIAKNLGFDKQEICLKLSKLKNVEGRFDCFKSKGGINLIVDYAHTPNALDNILITINQIRSKN